MRRAECICVRIISFILAILFNHLSYIYILAIPFKHSFTYGTHQHQHQDWLTKYSQEFGGRTWTFKVCVGWVHVGTCV